eukprot:9225284-Pyramimonas_sp.AAC.1
MRQAQRGVCGTPQAPAHRVGFHHASMGSIFTDPQVKAWAAPLYQWSLMFRDPQVPHCVLQSAWLRQIQEIYHSPHPWRHVSGPAGAT